MAQRRFTTVHAVLVVLLVGAVALLLWPGRKVREDPEDVLRALRDTRGPLLPDPGRAGATSATPTARYGRDTLYEVIDGAAEGYLARGFAAAAMATYAFDAPPADRFEVQAEAHRFQSEDGARAQAAAERRSGAAAVAGVPDAESDGSVLLAVAGRDLLKLTLLAPADGGREALAALAVAWRKETGR